MVVGGGLLVSEVPLYKGTSIVRNVFDKNDAFWRDFGS